MPSDHAPNVSKDQKIELILIGQTHSSPRSEKKEDAVLEQETLNNVIYSQFRILQIVQAFPDAVVLNESNSGDVIKKHQKEQYKFAFQTIFPQYQNFSKMEFQALDHNQRTILTNNQATQVLFQLGIIPCIYQTSRSQAIDPKLYTDFIDSYRKTIVQFPNLLAKTHRNYGVQVKDLSSMDELQEYERFMQMVHKKNPGIFLNREKEALDFALIAAQKSGKKQVILIFGRDHMPGFLNLLNTVYKDRIVLKEYIDSSLGFPSQDALKACQLQTSEGMKRYHQLEYRAASDFFAKTISFWKATPSSTPNKLKSLLMAEYNMGSSLFKLAESDETASYEQSNAYLEQAVDLAKNLQEPKNCKKYVNKLQESKRRACVSAFFSEMPCRIGQLIGLYSDDTETQTSRQ